jgi:tRNA A37 threonylcarbamoyladenosine biosynthesis protein TsaE
VITPGFSTPIEHALAELARMDLLLRRQVLRLRAARVLNDEALRGIAIPDALADALLGQGKEAPDMIAAESAVQLSKQIEALRRQNATRARSSMSGGIQLPMLALARAFGLNRFEADVLWLAAAAQVQSRYGTLFAYAHNDLTRPWLSVDLALQLLCETPQEQLERRALFNPAATLSRYHLVRFGSPHDERETTFLSRSVVAEERIADYLLGSNTLDPTISSFTSIEMPVGSRDEGEKKPDVCETSGFWRSDQQSAGGLASTLRRAAELARQTPLMLIALEGPYGSGKLDAARTLSAALGKPLLVADMQQALGHSQPLETTFALLLREAALQQSALYLAHFERLLADPTAAHVMALRQALKSSVGCEPLLVVIGTEAAWQAQPPWAESTLLHFKLDPPGYAQRVQAWERALHTQPRAAPDDDTLRAVAGKYALSNGQIEDAARMAEQLAALRGSDAPIDADDLRAAAGAQSNQGLQRIAQKVTPVYGWDDIVLPPSPMRQLREAYATLKQRQVVLAEWGFERKMALGKGTAILFAGPSGTGKTMAAQILAHELGLDLYKVDLSTLVSKYIGETEKNLSQIFKEAQTSNAILFFDEADALFGKRTEVKDAHDRYANIEVAYLLQRVEEYDGAVILASNLNQNMDDAFRRRLRHLIEFPFPDAEHRERIWRAAFPAQAPLEAELDFTFLARQFELSGGNIRNAAFAAALIAAQEDKSIGMQHLALAVLREMQKMGKLPARTDFRQYYDLLRERG